MRIGVDYDGVIADCTDLKRRLSKEWYGKDLLPEQCTTSVAKEVIGEANYQKIYRTIEAGELALECRPTAGTAKALGTLIAEGHKVLIVTSLDVPKAGNAVRFIRNHNIPYSHWISLPIALEAEKMEKSEIMKRLKLDVLVDDDYANLAKASGAGRLLLLFSQPWNKTVRIRHDDIQRANDWDEVLASIRDYALRSSVIL